MAQISDKFAGSLADGMRIVASRSLFDETALSCSSFQMRRHMRWAIAQMTFLTPDGEPPSKYFLKVAVFGLDRGGGHFGQDPPHRSVALGGTIPATL